MGAVEHDQLRVPLAGARRLREGPRGRGSTRRCPAARRARRPRASPRRRAPPVPRHARPSPAAGSATRADRSARAPGPATRRCGPWPRFGAAAAPPATRAAGLRPHRARRRGAGPAGTPGHHQLQPACPSACPSGRRRSWRTRARRPSGVARSSAARSTPSRDKSSSVRRAASTPCGGRRAAHLPVVAERLEGRGRHRVDGVGRDQLLHVDHVAVLGVLGAGARPQRPLRARPARARRRRTPAPPKISPKRWYTRRLFATAARPRRESASGVPIRSSASSTTVSTLLTKNDATEATRDGSGQRSTPRRYACATRS
jgi:hypothetical protein